MPKIEQQTLLTPDQCAAMRRVKRIPQKSLSAAIHRSQVYISNFELGRGRLTPREAKTISRILKISGGAS